MRIAAIVVGPGPGRDAVRAQERQPDHVFEHPGPWHEALTARPDGYDWLWLVRGDTAPEPDALGELTAVAAGRDGLPSPVLLASRVVDARGELDRRSTPWPPLHDRAGAMTAAEHHLAAVRLARWGSLLVDADAVRRHGPARAGLRGNEDLEWTARLLREAYGYLVPRSVAVRRASGQRTRSGPVALARALSSDDAWARHERLWVAYTLVFEGWLRSPSRKPRQMVAKLSRLPRLVRR